MAVRSRLPLRGDTASWLLVKLRRFRPRSRRRILVLRQRPVLAEHLVERIVSTRTLLSKVQIPGGSPLAARVVGDVGQQERRAGLLVFAGGQVAQILGEEGETVLTEHAAQVVLRLQQGRVLRER